MLKDQATYDSRADTYEHISRVRWYMTLTIKNLLNRALVHDQSKLVDPEKAAWDIASPKLVEMTYGSDEYKETLRSIKPIVQHHYRENTHHPEHYANGIRDMSLLDLLEMLCDWKAAGERTKNKGDIVKSIDYNHERFGFSDGLRDILLNTVVELGILK